MQETILQPEHSTSTDKVELVLQSISQNSVMFLFGLLPLLFLPIAYLPGDYVKTVLVIFGVCIAIVFFSLSVLRSGRVVIVGPLALLGLWLIPVSAIISALLSGDMRDSLIGDDFGVHTTLFMVLLAVVATVVSQTGQTKTSIMRLYILFTGSAIVLALFHIIRIWFGVDVFSFGVFTTLTQTPLGGWNDLALFFGLAILLSLVALEQLPLTTSGKSLFSSVIGLSLIMLAIINFFAVWIVLALVSLTVLMYSLTKDRFAEKTFTLEGKKNSVSVQSVLVSTAVFVVSIVFIVGGSTVGGYISSITNVSYLEVRPSFSATTEIARNVYAQNAFVGIGPNKFVDAWRLYKDGAINETVFWSTDFTGGSGYLTTAFVTSGIVGIAAWVAFFALFLIAGFRMLFRSLHTDRFWYFIGSSSFVGATYLWGMSALYVPGASMLLLAAVFTGITLTSYAALTSSRSVVLSVATNRKAGFVLVGIVMIVIVASTTALYYVGQHVTSVYTFSSAIQNLQNGSDVTQAEEQIARAYASSNNELYAMQLASYQLAKMNALATVPKLTAPQEQELQSSIRNGINAAQIVVAADPNDSQGWALLGSIYSLLAGASIEGSKDKAQEAFANARKFDPKNPSYALFEAQLQSRIQDLTAARARTMEAIALKRNYTDALFFLTQLDIFEGKTEDAIVTTQAITSFEPNNPARHYQLGVLQSAAGNLDEAIVAFTKAVALDTNYANARYFLAVGLVQKGDLNGAIAQLEVVLSLNPGNTEVEALIAQLKTGTKPASMQINTTGQVAEPQTVQSVDNTVTTTEVPDTTLVTPVNTVQDEAVTQEEVQ